MKKKILLASLMALLFVFLLTLCVSAETPSHYIEFGARFEGSDEYITVYTEDAEVSSGNPRINFATYKFYSDIDFTTEVDISTVTGIDFSVAKAHGGKLTYVNRITNPNPSSPFTKCTEVKWFTDEKAMDCSVPTSLFNGWSSLKSFEFGSLKKLGDNAFQGCGFEELVIPSTITHMYSRTFAQNYSLKSVKFEGSTELTGNANAFYQCTALESVDLGSVPYIGAGTFKECTSLTSIVIPSTVTEIKGSAFHTCSSLSSVTMNEVITSIGEAAFESCTSLTNIEIPSSVTTISKNAFYKCTALSTVKLGNISYIGEGMFFGCTSLTSINLPSTITEIKGNAFRECTSLTGIAISENVTSIGSMVFYKAGITSLHIPAKVQTLGVQVAELSAIQSLTFAENSQLKFIDHRAFRDCDSLVGPVILPEGLETVDYGIFDNCAKLIAVKLPESLTTITGDASLFSHCPSLEFVQFPKRLTNTTTIYKSMFEGCTSLKAISLPEGITATGYKSFRDCKNLQAVYLPSTLTSLSLLNDSSSDWGTFYQSPKVYFVDEPFDVFDGDTLIGDSFVMPEKPEIYYMPSSLTTVGNAEFQNCANLNSVIVFPEGVTDLDNCSQGAFFKACSSTNPVTLVFLGDITELRIRQNDNSYAYISFVFANPNDVDLNSLTLTIGSANNAYAKESYMYFCHGKVSYDLNTFKAANSTVYKVLETDFAKTVYGEGDTQPHFVNPKETKVVPADCENDTALTTFCFCGAKVSEAPEEGTALGHSHTIYQGITYESYLLDGYYSYKCDRCENVNTEKVAPKLFVCYGYSAPEFGNGGMLMSFAVNNEAIKDYATYTESKVSFGLFAATSAKLGNNDAVTIEGEAQNGAICANYTNRGFDLVEIKVTGFTTEEHMNAQVILGAYIIVSKDGEATVTYLQDKAPQEGEKYVSYSYNDLTTK